MYSYIGKPRSAQSTAGARTSLDRLRAECLEHREVRVHRAGNGERQMGLRPRPGRDAIEAAAAKEFERGQPRGRALAAHGVDRSRPRVVDDRHALAAERVRRRRFHHGRGEAGGHGGVERVAARQQHAQCRPSTPGDGRPRPRPACPRRPAGWSPSPRRDAPSRGSVEAGWSCVPHDRTAAGAVDRLSWRLDRGRERAQISEASYVRSRPQRWKGGGPVERARRCSRRGDRERARSRAWRPVSPRPRRRG